MRQKEKGFECIAYVGSTIKDLTPASLERKVELLAQENLALDITSLAIFARGNILVLIEGSNASKRFEALRRLPGQHGIIKLYSNTIPQRFFEDYALGLKILAPEEFKRLDSFKEPEKKEYFQEFLKMEHAVPRIVRGFINNNT